MTVRALGAGRIAGAPERKYRVAYIRPMPGEMTLWIDADGYPLQILTGGDGSGTGSGTGTGTGTGTTIRYSRFNDPAIRVQSP